MSTPNPQATPQVEEQSATQQAPREPSMYLVHILNDDYTPYEFVIAVLSGVFRHSIGESEAIAFKAHTQGQAVVGRYTLEVAETRVEIATRMAHADSFPLTFKVEPEPSPQKGPSGP